MADRCFVGFHTGAAGASIKGRALASRMHPVGRRVGGTVGMRGLAHTALVVAILFMALSAVGAWWFFYRSAAPDGGPTSGSTSAPAASASPESAAPSAPAANPSSATAQGTASSGSSASASGGAGGRPGGKGGRGGDGKPTPVTVRPVERGDMPEQLQVAGTAVALNTAIVRARVDGVLQTVGFREGDRVKAGDVLAQIDPQPFELAVRSAEGTLERDRALLKNAELDLLRFEDLWEKESVARQQLDTQRALVQQLKGSVQAGQAALDVARLNLSYTRIRAPIAGRLGLRLVDAGNTIRAGDANGLVTITQDAPMAVVFSVPDIHVARIQSGLRAGQTFTLEAYDRSGQTLLARGRVQSSDNAIDVATGTLRLKGVFPNADQALFPNQPLSIRLRIGERRGVLVVPASAVQRGADGSFVFVVDDEKTVSIRKVQTGLNDGERQEVIGDLEPGQRVVTEGVDRLRPGSKVEPVEADKVQGGRRKGGRPPAADGAAR